MQRLLAVSCLIVVSQLGLACSSGSKPVGAGQAGATGQAGTTAGGGAGTAGGAAGTTGAAAGTTGAAAGTTGAAAGTTGGAGTGAAGTGAAGTGTAGTGAAGTGAAGTGAAGTGAGGVPAMTFFVTSNTSLTGNLGGLEGADKRCQDLAAAAGQGSHTWHAYVSVASGPTGTPVNAKDRIGTGPWHNSKGALVANDLTELHAATKFGDHLLFIDEMGQPIPGQWVGSPAAEGVQHDILTGSNTDGTLKPGETCKDWTSQAAADKAWVGHSDGLGPAASMDAMYRSWNSTHENGGCDNTVPKGGKGRLYCFAIN